MKRLNGDSIYGIWAGITMCWDEAFRFDADTYAENIARIIRHRPHGIYTTGSTGEFYAIDAEEFRQMVDIQAELCGAANVPLQIGCCTDATHKTIALMEYAASKPQVGAAQIVLPYWMELNNREVVQFFKDLYRACPDLPIVHYNIPRAKRFLHGADYLRILEVCPTLVGVKYTGADSRFNLLQKDIAATPDLSYFVGEHVLASAMQIGARGCYSSMITTNPEFMQTMYTACEAGNWEKAIRMQLRISQFFAAMDELAGSLAEGDADPVFDKAVAIASGCITGHQRCRAPYIGWSDSGMASLRAYIQTHYPEFIYAGPETDSGSTNRAVVNGQKI